MTTDQEDVTRSRENFQKSFCLLFMMLGFVIGIVFTKAIDAYKEGQGPFYMYGTARTANGMSIFPVDFSEKFEIEGDKICYEKPAGTICWKGSYLITSPVPIETFSSLRKVPDVIQIMPDRPDEKTKGRY